MNSKERTLAAMNHELPDRVPIQLHGVGPLMDPLHDPALAHTLADRLLALGADSRVTIGIAPRMHPDVKVRDWYDDVSDPAYRLACREYDTPAGRLRAVMRCTEDCSYEGGVPLASDHNISRGLEFFIKGPDDLPKLAYLFQEPDRDAISQFRRRAAGEKRFAAKRGLPTEGDGGPGGDMAFWLCGPDLFYLVQDDPCFGRDLLDLLYDVDLKCMEILLDEGVDFVSARGFYETAPLWSPALFDSLFAPRLARKAQIAHQAGAKLSYCSSGDFVPHMDVLLAAEVDAVDCLRPVPGQINDIPLLKERIGRRICLWGGINPERSIENATVAETRRAVAEVILKAAAGGGFILSTGGSIWGRDCHENVVVFLDAARDHEQYPLALGKLQDAP